MNSYLSDQADLFRDKKKAPVLDFLIVEPQRQMTSNIKNMLKYAGYEGFHFAENGSEALQFMQKSRVRFIITSWEMPRLNGMELLQQLRNHQELFTIPVIMTSSDASRSKVIYAVEEGVDAYLIKPLSANEILKNVTRIEKRLANKTPFQVNVEKMTCLKIMKEYRQAVKIGQILLEERTAPNVSLITGECYFRIGDYEQAVCHLETAEEMEKNSKASTLLGKTYLGMGEDHRAIEHFRKAATRNPHNTATSVDLARAYFKVGENEEAEKILRGVRFSNPTDLALLRMGGVYLELGDLEKASEYLDRDLEPLPEGAKIFNKYAIALRKQGDYVRSARQHRRCLEACPDSPVVRYNLARTYSEMGDYPKARTMVLGSLELQPDFAPARALLQHVTSKIPPSAQPGA